LNCTKAIIPLAGYGTRRLPITKTIEKSMLPIVDRPVIDYIVEDCIKAGITDIYFVISPGSTQLQDYYSQKPDLAAYLRLNGKEKLLPIIEPPHGVQMHYVEQDTSPGAAYGTTIPVWLCREYVQPDEYVLVVAGDDFIFNEDGSSDTARLIQACQAHQGSALLAAEVPQEEASRYGVIASHQENGMQIFDYVQEKPAPGEAVSNLVNISKYIFDGRFMEYLDAAVQQDPSGAEYYITDPINSYVADGNAIQVITAQGQYLDSGTAENWIRANNIVFEAQKRKA